MGFQLAPCLWYLALDLSWPKVLRWVFVIVFGLSLAGPLVFVLQPSLHWNIGPPFVTSFLLTRLASAAVIVSDQLARTQPRWQRLGWIVGIHLVVSCASVSLLVMEKAVWASIGRLRSVSLLTVNQTLILPACVPTATLGLVWNRLKKNFPVSIYHLQLFPLLTLIRCYISPPVSRPQTHATDSSSTSSATPLGFFRAYFDKLC